MFTISEKTKAFITKEVSRYETKRSAIIPCLFELQKDNQGWINNDCIESLSQFMNIPSKDINEVFHFYTMFNKQSVGNFHIQVCCNISCHMNGGLDLFQVLSDKFNIKPQQVSKEGLAISKVECLGSCGTAPMMQVNEKYYENLTKEKAIQLVNDLVASKKQN
ncbi:MAG: NAD(P)H-dependent oxidoreductase subunit E [Bdellovibrionaceae bacterium]|nr:NAD(P)H-dependent oxidoreductase subunit E [Pseudobdellovibrionaceae bacterium]